MDTYEALRTILDAHPSSAPPSAFFDEILRILFTPDEAALATHMSFAPKSADSIAAAAGIEPGKAAAYLEAMADKAIIFCRDKEGKRSYGLNPTIPGLFEFPFMKDSDTGDHAALGRLWEQYHREALGASFADSPTSLARVIPVGEALESTTRVHPYEEVARLIEEAEYIALARCACRVSIGACDAPTEVCLIFNAQARFLVQRSFAREIGIEEARDVLDRSEKAGLVHTSNNSADRASFICNCCRCCCTLLRGRTQLDLPHAFAPSGFEARIDSIACTGCGICAEGRCPMDAIRIDDDTAVIDADRCIGCGLCVTACPVGVLSLVRRDVQPDVPPNLQEMSVRILTEKGKLKAFMKVMST